MNRVASLVKKYWSLILLAIFMVFGGYLRIYGLSTNYSFWMDEDHVAGMVRRLQLQGLSTITEPYGGGIYQIGLYLISSISTKIFGFNEMALRLPMVLFGVLTIWVVYLLSKKLFDGRIPLIASFLTSFLQIQILWSRQARPYQALQFFYLLGAYFIYRLATSPKIKQGDIIGFGLSVLGAIAFHGLGFGVAVAGIMFIVVVSKRKKPALILIPILLLLPLFGHYSPGIFSNIGKIFNFDYYRLFLTKNYLVLGILACYGALWLLFKKEWKKLWLLAFFSGTQLLTVTFVLGQPFARYIFIIMPFFYILAGYGIVQTGEILDTRYKKFIRTGRNFPISNIQYLISLQYLRPLVSNIKYLISLILFLGLTVSLFKSDKIVIFPRPYYSLNNDMLEVPEVDWKAIYRVVEDNGGGTEETPLISNWGTTPQWYLGEKVNLYLARLSESDRIINNVAGLQKIIDQYPRGIVVFDSWDNHIPAEILQYCRDNMQLIYENDRLYPVQPRYWTVWVFRWGTEKP